jgi:hypothetical protein
MPALGLKINSSGNWVKADILNGSFSNDPKESSEYESSSVDMMSRNNSE